MKYKYLKMFLCLCAASGTLVCSIPHLNEHKVEDIEKCSYENLTFENTPENKIIITKREATQAKEANEEYRQNSALKYQEEAEALREAIAVAETNNYSGYSGGYGWDGSNAKEWIAGRESGGDYNAVSPSGKYIGKYQLDYRYLNGDYSIENQERVVEEYVNSRYGSWENAAAFWNQNGWY